MKVVVVGGGIAGLGAANEFSKQGHEVRVLEAEARVGGRAMLLRRPGSEDRCDVGTQYYHSSYRRALGLIREVGLSGELAKISGATRFFDDRVSGGSFLVDHRLPWMKPGGLKGNLRAAAFLAHRLIRHRMRTFELEDRPYLDQTPALEVLADPFLREFIVRPLVVAGALNAELAEVSLLQVMRLIRIILLTDYLSLSGGVSSLHDALGERLDVRLEAPGEQLIVDDGKVTGVALESGEAVSADHVVVATTAPRAAALLPPEWSLEREFLSDVTLPPALIVSFFLDRPLERGVWSYYLPASHAGAVSFCTDAAQKNPAMVPSGKAILQAWICYPSSARWIKESDSDVIDVCRRELEERLPGFSSWVEEAVVTRHVMGVPWHPAGHHTRALSFLESADRRDGVSFCGDYLSGGYLEPALWTAERAALRVG